MSVRGLGARRAGRLAVSRRAGRLAAGCRLLASLLVCVPALLVLTPAGAEAASNQASTHAFLAANYAFLKASVSEERTVRKRIASESKKILQQCGSEAAGSPQDQQSYEMSYEVAVALWSVSYGAGKHIVAKLSRKVSRLHWSNHALSRDVKSYVKSLKELSHIPMPPVCEDIASWKASGFTVVPASTKRIDKKVEPLEVKPVPAKLLDRYSTRSDRTMVRRSENLRQRLLNFETAVGANSWLSLLEELELNN